MLVWTFLHIITMFLAVASTLGLWVIMHRVARSGDVRAIRTIFRLAKPMVRIFSHLFFIVGVIFGLIAASVGNFNFFAPWLIIAYVLLAIGALVGGGLVSPSARRIPTAILTLRFWPGCEGE